MTAKEILRDKFKNNFLDIEYIDIILEAMQLYALEYHRQQLDKPSLENLNEAPAPEY